MRDLIKDAPLVKERKVGRDREKKPKEGFDVLKRHRVHRKG